MPIRVVLIGVHPADLRQQLGALPASLELQILGSFPDQSGARAALASLTPDIAIIASALVDGSGFTFVGSLPEASRPHAIVFLSSREEDAIRAFELEATDVVPVPIASARLADAMTRARHRALRIALLRTADELHRLIGATASSPAGVAPLGAPMRAPSAINTDTQSPRSDGEIQWSLAAVEGQDSWRPDGSGGSGGASLALTSVGGERSNGSFSVNGAKWRQAIAFPVQRAGKRRAREDGGAEGVLDLTRTMEQTGSPLEDGRPLRVLIREARRTLFIPLADVDWFEADGNYILVHAADRRYRTRGTITAIETGLDPRQFARIHRRMVVNMDRVREMSPLPGGDRLLLLGGGTTLRLSRTYRARVR